MSLSVNCRPDNADQRSASGHCQRSAGLRHGAFRKTLPRIAWSTKLETSAPSTARNRRFPGPGTEKLLPPVSRTEKNKNNTMHFIPLGLGTLKPELQPAGRAISVGLRVALEKAGRGIKV